MLTQRREGLEGRAQGGQDGEQGREIQLAIALCYEILYPTRIAARRGEDTLAILNPSSDAWLRDPGPVSRQLTAFGRFRAIEQRLALVRISDGGESVAIDASGRTLESLSAKEAGSVLVLGRASPGATGLEQVVLLALALGGAGAGFLAARAAAPKLSTRLARGQAEREKMLV